jgi:hypothetical protein
MPKIAMTTMTKVITPTPSPNDPEVPVYQSSVIPPGIFPAVVNHVGPQVRGLLPDTPKPEDTNIELDLALNVVARVLALPPRTLIKTVCVSSTRIQIPS